MQQQELVNEILKLIEEKQKNREFGTITIHFDKGKIQSVNENRTRRLKVNKGSLKAALK